MTGCGGTALRKISLQMVAISMGGSGGVAFDAESRAMLHESIDVKVHLRESISVLTKKWLPVAVMFLASNVPPAVGGHLVKGL